MTNRRQFLVRSLVVGATSALAAFHPRRAAGAGEGSADVEALRSRDLDSERADRLRRELRRYTAMAARAQAGILDV